MKPAPFEYRRPDTVDEAVALLAEHGDEAKILAGGQSLIPTMNFRLAQPALLIDIGRLTDLDYIRRGEDRDGPAGGVRIGALTRQRTAERSSLIAERVPLIAEAMPHVAHVQIRNRGTVGGSVAHADPAAELPVLLVALGGEIRARSSRGERTIAAGDFFTGLLDTALEPDELLIDLAVPALPERTGCAFVEFARRHGDYALAGAAAVITRAADGVCTGVSAVLMSVGERPMPAVQVAATLTGQQPTAEAIGQAASAAARRDIDPHSDVHATSDYRRHLAEVMLVRALTAAAERAGA